MENFKDMTVIGTCGADLYSLWSLAHSFDDSFNFGGNKFLPSSVRSSWVSFVNAIDAAIDAGFSCHGSVDSSVVFFFTNDKDK